MDAYDPHAPDPELLRARTYVAEALKQWEADMAARAQRGEPPRTWRSFVPQRYLEKLPADADPAARFRQISEDIQAGKPLPDAPRQLTADQCAKLDAMQRARREAQAEEAPKIKIKPPPKKKAKVAVPRPGSIAAQAALPPAAPAPALSQRAINALDRAWDLEWNGENPFRTRLSDETLAYFGMDDYCAIVGGEQNVVDLALVRSRVRDGAYASDAALRADVRRIATNCMAYWGGGGKLGENREMIAQADQLAAAYDAAYAGN
mmetsp:Transcript_22586/g.67771  ORF Transcript_22586/g.67771 Transcript_22586/m.67771 type:complete len:263 (+) Transcript_22586:150-938(+)